MDSIFKIIKLITQYSYIWLTILTIIGAISIYKYKEEKENYFILKIIGFYLLGAFSINLQGLNEICVYLPVGYFIYYFFIKNKDRSNQIVKDKYAKLGLIILCIIFLNNLVYNYLKYRDMSMNSSCKIESLNKEWEKIKEKCYIDDNTLLRDARVLYNENGEIKDLNYYMIDYNKNKSYFLNISHNKYIIEVNKYYGNMTYDLNGNSQEYITTDDFLEVTNNINSGKFFNKKRLKYNDISYSYYSYDDEEYLEDDDIYGVHKNKNKYNYEKLDTKNLYIVGPTINLYLNSNGEEYYSANFTFDFRYDE